MSGEKNEGANGERPSSWLGSSYYDRCHRLFRSLTDQPQLMLEHVVANMRGRSQVEMLSVGSGAGLFELPLITRLNDAGIQVTGVVGIDLSEAACEAFAQSLQRRFGRGLRHNIVAGAYGELDLGGPFDLILFNHVLEYAGEAVGEWLVRALEDLVPGGCVLIFSPIRGGINQMYEEFAPSELGFSPAFADEVQSEVDALGIDHRASMLRGRCDVSPLAQAQNSRTQLLSFLTQRDCRRMSEDELTVLAAHYLDQADASLRLPHPTMVFELLGRKKSTSAPA